MKTTYKINRKIIINNKLNKIINKIKIFNNKIKMIKISHHMQIKKINS